MKNIKYLISKQLSYLILELVKALIKSIPTLLTAVPEIMTSLVNDFINWIKEQDFYENTTIVIVGDHLTMQSDFYEEKEGYKRSIYNGFNKKTS